VEANLWESGTPTSAYARDYECRPAATMVVPKGNIPERVTLVRTAAQARAHRPLSQGGRDLRLDVRPRRSVERRL
jgi:hypothetical protein